MCVCCRSCIRKIYERDDTPGKRMVLCVAEVRHMASKDGNTHQVQLSLMNIDFLHNKFCFSYLFPFQYIENKIFFIISWSQLITLANSEQLIKPVCLDKMLYSLHLHKPDLTALIKRTAVCAGVPDRRLVRYPSNPRPRPHHSIACRQYHCGC